MVFQDSVKFKIEEVILLTLVPKSSIHSCINEPLIIEEEATIGRSSDNDIAIPDNALSRSHCKIKFHSGKYTIEDLCELYENLPSLSLFSPEKGLTPS